MDEMPHQLDLARADRAELVQPLLAQRLRVEIVQVLHTHDGLDGDEVLAGRELLDQYRLADVPAQEPVELSQLDAGGDPQAEDAQRGSSTR